MCYIPDMTERFPQGMRDLYEPKSNGYEPSYEEILEEERREKELNKPRKFEIGNEYEHIGNYGGITVFKVEEIDRENNKILMSEVWIDVDGTGTRPAEWHKLEEDEKGNEKAFYYHSTLLECDVYIWA